MRTQYPRSQSTQFLLKQTHAPKVSSGVVYWFRNDLRLHDNPALQQAIALAQRHHTWLLPVYVQDTALQLTSPWGFVRTSAQRLAWTAMAVYDVAQQLAAFRAAVCTRCVFCFSKRR
jgi:deoxyribodipyrimidine photolyase